MRSTRFRLALGLALCGPLTQGCGCVHDRQVIFKERRGGPVRVDADDGVRVKAPFVDVRVPGGKQTLSGEIDVPMIDPD